MKKRVWRSGDVIQVTLPSAYRYLQFVGKDSKRVDVLRVLDLTTNEPLRDLGSIEKSGSTYWIQSLCSVLLDDPRFVFIGNAAGAGSIPPFRRQFVRGWIIVEGGNETFSPDPISDEIAKLSIEQGVPAQWILDSLVSGWRPENDRVDLVAATRRDKEQVLDARNKVERETVFFIDFPTSEEASKAMAELGRCGFHVERESQPQSLAVKREWRSGDSLDSMDVVELQIVNISSGFGGAMSGRETSS